MNTSKKQYSHFMRRNQAAILAYGVMLVIFIPFAANQADFATKYGPQSIFNQVIVLVVASLAQTFAVLTAGIDLSVGSMIGLSNAFAAIYMGRIMEAVGNQPLGIILTLIIAVLIACLCGFINGMLVTIGRIQPIIATLATSMVYGGVALLICPQPGGTIPREFASTLTGFAFGVIPMSAIVLLIIILIWIPLRRSRKVQGIYAVGGNEYSAFVSGINVNRTKISAYMLTGLFAGVASVLLTAQTSTGNPLGAENLTIDSVSAVVLGGVALTGGKGSFIGAIAGAVTLSLILGLLIFWSVSSFYQSAVRGLILIAALTLGIFSERRKVKAAASDSETAEN